MSNPWRGTGTQLGPLHGFLRSGNSWPHSLVVHSPDWSMPHGPPLARVQEDPPRAAGYVERRRRQARRPSRPRPIDDSSSADGSGAFSTTMHWTSTSALMPPSPHACVGGPGGL